MPKELFREQFGQESKLVINSLISSEYSNTRDSLLGMEKEYTFQ